MFNPVRVAVLASGFGHVKRSCSGSLDCVFHLVSVPFLFGFTAVASDAPLTCSAPGCDYRQLVDAIDIKVAFLVFLSVIR